MTSITIPYEPFSEHILAMPDSPVTVFEHEGVLALLSSRFGGRLITFLPEGKVVNYKEPIYLESTLVNKIALPYSLDSFTVISSEGLLAVQVGDVTLTRPLPDYPGGVFNVKIPQTLRGEDVVYHALEYSVLEDSKYPFHCVDGMLYSVSPWGITRHPAGGFPDFSLSPKDCDVLAELLWEERDFAFADGWFRVMNHYFQPSGATSFKPPKFQGVLAGYSLALSFDKSLRDFLAMLSDDISFLMISSSDKKTVRLAAKGLRSKTLVTLPISAPAHSLPQDFSLSVDAKSFKRAVQSSQSEKANLILAEEGMQIFLDGSFTGPTVFLKPFVGLSE